MHNRNCGKKVAKNVGNVSNFQKLPKANNRPLDKNSPNLVTLIATDESMYYIGRQKILATVWGQKIGGKN
jgi:hypothetical protein